MDFREKKRDRWKRKLKGILLALLGFIVLIYGLLIIFPDLK